MKLGCSKLLHNVEMYYLHTTNYLTTDLTDSKLNTVYLAELLVVCCHDRLAQKCHNSCSKCAPRTWTQISAKTTRVSLVSLGPGKRRCCVLDAQGRLPVETQNKRSKQFDKKRLTGAHSPVRGHPRGSKVVPLNSWGRVSY